jgi:hypothetical protein
MVITTSHDDDSIPPLLPFPASEASPPEESSSLVALPISNHGQSPLSLLSTMPTPPFSLADNDTDADDVFQFYLKKSPPFAIFYNVYIPKDNNSTMTTANEEDKNSSVQEDSPTRRRARRIFHEQMKTVGNSYANSLPGKPVTVYYNTIGDGAALNASFVHDVCTLQYNFTCRHLQHYEKAFEDVTLQALYEFCHVHDGGGHELQRQQNVDDDDDDDAVDLRVAYMHNKGSFNKARYQNDNRRIFTQTVTSQACLQLSPQQQDCNVCGQLFQPVSERNAFWNFPTPKNNSHTLPLYVNRIRFGDPFLVATFGSHRAPISVN